MTWLHEVHRDPAMTWPQHTRRDLDHSGEERRIADRPDALRIMAIVHPEVLASPERAR